MTDLFLKNSIFLLLFWIFRRQKKHNYPISSPSQTVRTPNRRFSLSGYWPRVASWCANMLGSTNGINLCCSWRSWHNCSSVFSSLKKSLKHHKPRKLKGKNNKTNKQTKNTRKPTKITHRDVRRCKNFSWKNQLLLFQVVLNFQVRKWQLTVTLWYINTWSQTASPGDPSTFSRRDWHTAEQSQSFLNNYTEELDFTNKTASIPGCFFVTLLGYTR